VRIGASPPGLQSVRYISRRLSENSVVPPGLYSFLPLFPALKCVRENWVVPPGLRSFFPLFPALKRWAKLVRPSGAAFSSSSFHRIAKTSVLTHTLKRWAKLGRPSGAGYSDISFHWIARKRGFFETLKGCATQKQEQDRVFQDSVKPSMKVSYRSGKPPRPPKSNARASFSALCITQVLTRRAQKMRQWDWRSWLRNLRNFTKELCA
jgi:hypothetical protein